MALIVAGACHDYEHPGVNNAYLTETKHALAIKYNGMQFFLIFEYRCGSARESSHSLDFHFNEFFWVIIEFKEDSALPINSFIMEASLTLCSEDLWYLWESL